MTKPYEEKKINISLLDLDKGNPRFLMLYKDSKNEHDIINYLINNENAIDIVKSINTHKEYFPDSFCYVIERNGRYIVKEGNRRIAALKALAKPQEYLGEKYTQFIVEEVPCLVYKDERKLSEKIVTRHTQIEIKGWERLSQGAYVQSYIDNGGKLSDLKYLKDYKRVYQVFKLWEASSNFEGYSEKVKQLLVEWKRSSIVERFFGRSDLLEKMGFSFDGNYSIQIMDKDIFRKSLDCLLSWLAPENTDITAHKITKKTIDNYFDEVFSENGYSNPQKGLFDETTGIGTPESETISENDKESLELDNPDINNSSNINQFDSTKEVENDLGQTKLESDENSTEETYEETIKLNFKERNTLISNRKKNIVPGSYTKTHNLFKELSKINVKDNPTCIALGFRAFIEYSCKIYMSEIKGQDVQKIENSNISGSIRSIAAELFKNNFIDKSIKQYIDRRYNEQICPLNDIVHGHNYAVNSTQLCMDWDAYQPLLEQIWLQISKGGKK